MEVPNPVVEQVPVPEPYEVIEYRDVCTLLATIYASWGIQNNDVEPHKGGIGAPEGTVSTGDCRSITTQKSRANQTSKGSFCDVCFDVVGSSG